MARKLEEFPSSARRYPWPDWLDGSPWELTKDDDYRARTETMLANAREQARKRGGRLRAKRLPAEGGQPERLVLQFLHP